MEIADGMGRRSAAGQTKTEYRQRAKHMCDAYETVATLHNEAGLTAPLTTTCRRYYGRPYRVLFAERFANALAETVTDPQLRILPRIGGVDQWADNTDFLGSQELRHAVINTLP